MFESLSKRLTESLDKLRRKGRLSEADVEGALRDIRMALLEADVALPVARDFIADLKGKLVGADIVQSVSPANMVVKLVYDALVGLLDPMIRSADDPMIREAGDPRIHGSSDPRIIGSSALRKNSISAPPPPPLS